MKSFLPAAKRLFLVVITMAFGHLITNAQTIKGTVTDARDKQPLIGATVHIEQGSSVFNTGVRLDGIYMFKNIPAGTYKLHVSFLGYKTTQNYTVQVEKNGTAVLNIAMADNSTSLGEVVVKEHASKESDGAARNTQKNANNTMNVISASAIAISPDVIVSNVLGRVSGISIDRSNTGDAQHVIIRGMEKQYNTTLINGIKIPSPDNKNRYVPLDIFPADLVERIEVSKSLTPDMEGDASGGVVNLVMKTAPDHLRIEGNVGTGYSQLFLKRDFSSFDRGTVHSKSPGELLPPLGSASISDFPYQNLVTHKHNAAPNTNVSLTVGDRFLNNKLGAVFSGTYQNSYQGDNSFVVVQENTVGPAPNINTPNQETAFQSSYVRQYSSQLSRLGTIASLDYRFNANHSINLFGTYLQLNEYRVRETETSTYSGYSYKGYVATNGIDNLTETRTDQQSIYNITLKGKHRLSNAFSFDWAAATSKATHKQPDIAQFKTTYSTSPAAGGTNEPAPGDPNSSVYVAPGIINGPVLVGNESRVWTHNTDKDLSGYLNLHYDTKIFGRKALFSAGGMTRHKTRDNYVNSYSLPNTIDAGTNNAETYTSIPAATFTFDNNPGNARGSAYSDPGVYTFTENIQAGYGMLKYFISDRLDVLLGERVEHTDQSYFSNLPATFPGKTAAINYTDYLPSVNAKYALTDNQAIRASYFKSILRPAFADFIPYPNTTVDDPYATIGNPYLQHTEIDNYDLRYEFFPGVFDEFMAGGFYKHLVNPIETVLSPGQNGAALFLTPQNLGTARNYGAELVAKKFFGNIGFSVNYTYTQSRITTPKSIDVINVGVTTRNQTRPLQGQAAHIGNVSLIYKDQKSGIDAQLSLAYTGERIQAVSKYYNLDTWEKASTFLDFSAQKQLGGHFIVFVKANNLLNTPYQLFIKQNNANNYSSIMKYAHQESPNYTTVQYDEYFARYSLGMRFKFQ
ncbi:TonB-dependent receptor domain-containing protein [Mucilaginibacter angelicae]|uniref:TonB-dependent receptor domain-containing protein n=1 Tax=Mucilaginibacter angelicae TaxID=869718 RepID=A0ABV6L667_9SPHI